MKKFVFFLLTACLLVFNCSSSHAEESITYVDEDGIQHYLEKYNLINDCEESFTIGESDKETWYVIKEDTLIKGNITIKGEVNLVLMGKIESKIVGSIILEDNNILKIWGDKPVTGKLIVEDYTDDASIGSRVNNKCGIFEMHSGYIKTMATGYFDLNGGAGIGSGHYGQSGYLSFYGGEVHAKGGYRSAGIGGGANCSGGKIDIYGGNITASGGDYGAGIGSGDEVENRNNNMYVYIAGGSVSSYGGCEAAGIGGGNESGAGYITITGEPYVYAKGGYGNSGTGAGIGTGDEGGDRNGEVVIQGGIVKAYGGDEANWAGGGAGIGGGSETGGFMVKISGGDIFCRGGDWGSADAGGAGIGGGTLGAGGTTYIYGGTVKARGGADAAGIGGGDGGYGGYTYINGGLLNVYGSLRGAGIGSGEFSERLGADDLPGGTTEIHGGIIHTWGGHGLGEGTGGAGIGTGTRLVDDAMAAKVIITSEDDIPISLDAFGGKNCAGIGGGYNGNGADVTIDISDKSRVYALGAWAGAGIGSGRYGKHAGKLTVENGYVEAEGGYEAAGIGGGGYSNSGYVTINGGYVYATGGEGGAGIGGGYAGNQDKPVTINGGYVKAIGTEGGAGIGGGCENDAFIGGEGGPVYVNGGTVVASIYPITTAAKAIGNGATDHGRSYSIDIYPSGCVKAGLSENMAELQPKDKRESACSELFNHWVMIDECDHDKYDCVDLNHMQHQKTCHYCDSVIAEGHIVHGGKCILCNNDGCDITFKPGDGGIGEMAPQHIDPCTDTYTLPECGFTNKDGKIFMAWLYKKDGMTRYGAPGFDIEVSDDIELEAYWDTKKHYCAYVDSNIKNGKIVVGPYPDIMDEGETAIVTATPDPGYKLISLSYSNLKGDTVQITEKDGSGNYVFTMPAENIKISAVFIPVPAESIIINPDNVELREGESTNLSVSFTPEYTADKVIVWSSNDGTIASVDKNGEVTAEKYGETTIYAATSLGGIWNECKVVVHHTHSLEKIEAKEATCTDDGNIEYWCCKSGYYHCDRCYAGEHPTKELDPKLNYDEGGIIIPAKGHSWKIDDDTDEHGWKIVKEPTETEEGKMIRECTACETVSERIIPSTHVHNLSLVEEQEPSCLTPGKKEHYKCDCCDELFLDPDGFERVTEDELVIEPTGHKELSPVKEDEIPATSDKDGGYYLVTRCEKCGLILNKEWIVIPATGESDDGGSDDKGSGGKDSGDKGSDDKLITGWIEIDGKWYYFYSDGEKACSEYVDGYWLSADGSWDPAYYGGHWLQNEKGWWYEDSSGYYPVSTWLKIDGYWYYFDESGYMASGEWRDGYWLSENGAWEYEGVAEWKTDGKNWWYEDNLGWYPVNTWQKIDGSWYYFEATGYMSVN